MSQSDGGGGSIGRYVSALSRHPDAATAIGEVVGRVAEGIEGRPSAAVLFVSGAHIDDLHNICDAVRRLLNPQVLIGATAVGVVGGSEEVEAGDSIVLWAAAGFSVEPVRLEALPGSPPILAGLPDSIDPGSALVVVADPQTFPVDALVTVLNDEFPSVAVAGGLASAPGTANRVVLDDTIHLDGAVGFIVPPGLATPVVSQGCRPIGSPWVITRAEGRLVHELGGKPALERLTEVVDELSDADRAIASQGLFIGVVANEQQADFDRGDFLIRGVLGADRSTGAVAVGDQVEIGQILQFQVRDATSAGEELERLLAPVSGRSALVFTCNGRGSHMFDIESHDAGRVHEEVGDAVAGMFCAGELGPIGDRNAIHTFTATVLVFH